MMKLLIFTGKKLTFEFSSYISALPPYIHLTSTHVNKPKAFSDLIFHRSSASVCYTECKLKNKKKEKNRGGQQLPYDSCPSKTI